MNVWFRFLAVRRELINSFRVDGKSCTEIASILSMDAGQVYLISQVENGKPPADAINSIQEHFLKMFSGGDIEALKDYMGERDESSVRDDDTD